LTMKDIQGQNRSCRRENDIAANGFNVNQNIEEMIRQVAEKNAVKLVHRPKPRKLVHGMIFDCEEWMLEIKLNEIGDTVDYFVIVEGLYTLQNTKKQQCFPHLVSTNERIAAWSHKIVYLYDEKRISDFKYWEAEVYYRDLIGLEGLEKVKDLHDDDLVIVTDMDELIHPNFLWVLKWYDGFKPLIRIHLLWSYYSFKWVNAAPKIVDAIVSVQELSLVGNRTNRIRFDMMGHEAHSWNAEGVGWHCSWCIPTEQFRSKMSHFSHSELNMERYKDIKWLHKIRENGLWFPDSAPNGCTQSRMQIPSYVEKNMDKFNILVN
jgi:hypothetical protein